MSDEIRNTLLQLGVILLSVATPLLLGYVRMLARRLAALLEIQLSEKQWNDVDAALEIAVHRADELGRTQLARGLEISSGEKLQAAIETARRVGPRGLSDYDDTALRDMVEAKLHAMRSAPR